MPKYFIFILLLTSSCIGEDIVFDEVDPEVRLSNPITALEVNTDYQFEYMFLDNVGMFADPSSVVWTSSDQSIATVQNGLVTGLSLGEVTIGIEARLDDLEADTTITFEVIAGPTSGLVVDRSGTIATTSSYLLQGDFALSQVGDDLLLEFSNNYAADTGLPGLYIYLTNNPSTTSGAYEIGPVTVFTGAHSYTIPDTDLLDFDYVLYFCKPFNVKVGDGEIE